MHRIAALERLEEWEAAHRRAVECRLLRVGARAAVAARTEEMMRVITILEQLYRHQFRASPVVLVLWGSARKVAWPSHKAAGPARMSVEEGTKAGR